jgi:hypothetical protein
MKSDRYKGSREEWNMYCEKYAYFFKLDSFWCEEKDVNKPKLLHHVLYDVDLFRAVSYKWTPDSVFSFEDWPNDAIISLCLNFSEVPFK